MAHRKSDPTPAEAVVTLRAFAIAPGTPENITAAIAILLDHVMRVEQTLSLIDDGHQSAMRHAPTYAVLAAARKKTR